MARDAFVPTPFVDVGPADVHITLFSTGGGDPSVVLHLAPGLAMHAYDQRLLVRLIEVASQGRDLLAAALSGQEPLPVADTAA